MKDLLKANCLSIEENIVIVGSCLKSMHPNAYKELEAMSGNIYDVCLESTHLNMVIAKLLGILSRVKVNKIVFATVDKSPHCVQMHYIESELTKAIKDLETEFIHYVAIDDKLKKIDLKVIKKSKSLGELQDLL